MILELTDEFVFFKAPYDAEFGTVKNGLTSQLWEWISRRYASQLSGNVEVYTRLSALSPAVTQAGAKAVARGGTAEDLRLLPQITAEIEQIADIMLENPRITHVSFIDATSGHVETVMTRVQVLRAAHGTSGGTATLWQ